MKNSKEIKNFSQNKFDNNEANLVFIHYFSSDILIDMTVFRFGKIRKQTNSNCQHRMFKNEKGKKPNAIHSFKLHCSSVLKLL